jgi:hypothetical protein
MIVLAYLGSQSTTFHAAGWMCWFFTSFYLELCIWPDVMSRWIWQRNSIKFCANLIKSEMETLAMTRQMFREESTRSKWKSPTHRDRKWWDRWRAKSKEHAHHFFLHQGDCSQRIHPSRTNSHFHILLWHFMATTWKCAKTLPWTGDKRTGCCITIMHHLPLPFSLRNFLSKTTWLSSFTHPTFSVSPIEDKTESLPF